jgi:tetratricopeptide (TPR) repeat protein
MPIFRLFVLFLFSSQLSFSQKTKEGLANEYLKKQDSLYVLFQFEKANGFAKKAKKIGIELNDSKIRASAYQKMMSNYLKLGQYKESIESANNALKEDYTNNNLIYKLTCYKTLGIIYNQLNYKEKATENFKNLIKEAPRNTNNVELKILIASGYFNLGLIYDYVPENADSIDRYMGISQKILEECPPEEVAFQLYYSYISFANSNTELRHRLDSSKIYLDKAYNVIIKYKPDFIMTDYNISLGRYYFMRKDYKKALGIYLKVVQAHESNPYENTNLRVVYQDISEIYETFGDEKKSKEYYEKFFHLSDDLNENKKKSTEFTSKNILKDEIEVVNLSFTKKIALTTTSFLIILFAALVYYRKQKRKFKIQHLNSQEDIQEKEIIILEKEKEAAELKQIANTSFSEVLELAKENNPHFLKRFQEVYPEFYNNILKINPNLRSSEISLSAYIFLGFSNKEIAEYTFKSIRTIESNRYNLRKKLYLYTEIDLFVWLNSLKEF